MPKKITVALQNHSYDIYVGEGLLDQAGDIIAPLLSRPRTVIVTDDNIAGYQLPRLEKSLEKAGITFDSIILPAGEATKSFAQLENLLDRLLAFGLERQDRIIAFGGGVIGDLAGFAASIYQRGIGFIQIPTTLLAQVDSAVGGKCAINSPRGKNLIGSFHQPGLVLSDVSCLNSLPQRQLLAGYAEMVKYSLINDGKFFDWLDRQAGKIISGDPAARIQAIITCCQAKADMVARDEKETGPRALLNLGHTFGHALEAECGFSDRLLHGEAVAIGMVMAFDLSVRMGLCPEQEAATVRRHLKMIGLPDGISADLRAYFRNDITAERLFNHTLHDKKLSGGKVTYVLVRAIGEAFLTNDVTAEDIKQVFQSALDG